MIASSLSPAPFASARPALSNDLVRQYTPRIRRHAARYARRLPARVTVADLVSAGFAGLVDAFLRFDVTRMESFEAYIDHRIRGAILDELRSHDPLTRDQRQFSRRAAAVAQRLTATLGRTPTEQEVAAEMQLSLEAFRHTLWRASDSAARGRSLLADEEMGEVAGHETDRPDVLAEGNERRARVLDAMESLTPRQQQMLRLYYQDGLTLRQIADEFGVTESRVSQIHSEAVARMRGAIAEC